MRSTLSVPLFFVLAGAALWAGEPLVLGTPAPRLSRATVPAAGRATVDVEVDRVGRYAFTVRGPVPAGLQLVDRMTGPGMITREGRIDRILDRGKYRLVVHGAAKAAGELTVEGFGSTEKSGEALRSLVEPRTLAETLGDHEQRSWWLKVDEARTVWIEAAGRHLVDLRIWEQGAWLHEATPGLDTIEPVKGRPLGRARLAVKLDPGLFLVTAYGGAALPWADGSAQTPLWVRVGMPRLPPAGRRRFTVSPFGVDRFRLPGKADYVRLELPEPRQAALAVGALDPANPFEGGSNRAGILKTSLDPVAELTAEASGDDRVLTVEAAAGQPYVLQHFARTGSFEAGRAGSYWVASIHAGDPRDSIDATGMLVARRWGSKGWETELLGGRPLELGPAEAFARRANLHGPLSMILHTEEAGVWQVLLAGTEARCRVEPFLVTKPDGYSAPPLAPSGTLFPLDPGYHELTVEPDQAGILDLCIRPAGAVDQMWKPHGGKGAGAAAVTVEVERETTIAIEIPRKGRYVVTTKGGEVLHRLAPFRAGGRPGDRQPDFEESGTPWSLAPGAHVLTLRPVRPGRVEVAVLDEAGALGWDPSEPGQWKAARTVRGAVRFAPVRLDGKAEHSLWLGRQPGVEQGVICRSLPIDLLEPLYVSQQPGETITIEAMTGNGGRLEAVAEDGSPVPVSVDGGSPAVSPVLAAGQHVLRVTWAGDATLGYTVGIVPRGLDPEVPLAVLPATASAGLPDPPRLGAGAPRILELGRGARTSCRVDVEAPGLYELQSTGLLAMGGRLRTRTLPSFAAEAENGPGRNFLIQRLLGSGSYLLSAETRGLSRGHVGLELRPSRVVDGGEVVPGRAARRTVAAGEAVAWTATVAAAGSFRIGVETLGRPMAVTIEDADGWPLVAPGIRSSWTLALDPGRYRVVSWPEPVLTRRILAFEPQVVEAARQGHGPHRLPLDLAVEHEWVDPGTAPDLWDFDLPAPTTVFVMLDPAMAGTLRRPDGSVAARLGGGRFWGGPLGTGKHRLEVAPTRRDNRVGYGVRVKADRLVEGNSRTVTAPGSIPLSVGRDGVLELASRAPRDVRARLVGEDGRELARADDRPDDWNFFLRAPVEPGRYRLEVEPVGSGFVSFPVDMAMVGELALPAVPVPGAFDLAPGPETRLVPLAVGVAAGMLVVEVDGAENLGASLDRPGDPTGAPGASAQGRSFRLEVPWEAGSGNPTLRLTELDRQGGPVHVRVRVAPVVEASEAELAAGTGGPGRAGERAYRKVRLARPGLFRFGPGAGLLVSASAGRALVGPPADGIVGSATDRLWVGSDGGGAAPAAQRITLVPGAGPPGSGPGAARLAFRLRAGEAAAVDLGGPAGPRVAWARAASGAPGLAFGATPSGGFGVAPGRALAVSEAGGADALLVFDAGREGGDLALELGLVGATAPEPRPAPEGRAAGTVEPGRSLLVGLGAGPAAFRVALGRGLVGRYQDAGGTRVLGSPEVASLETVTARGAASLLLVGIGAAPAPYAIGPGEGGSPGEALGAGGMGHGRATEAGLVRVPIAAPRGGPVLLATEGSVRRAAFVGESGRVLAGPGPIQAEEAGELRLDLAPGVWSARAGLPADAAGPGAPAAIEVGAGGGFALEGAVQRFAFRGAAPLLAHVRLSHPGSVRLEAPGQAPLLALLPSGGHRAFFLAAGTGTVEVRPLGSDRLVGRAELATEVPAALGEGRGPLVLVPPGETRSFLLVVAAQARLGLGVECDPETARVELTDPAGARVGRGASQLRDLGPGTWLLGIEAPADGPPVAARPVVVGLSPPDPGPPPDEVARFRALVESAPAGQRGER